MRSTVIGFLVSRRVGGWELHPGDQLKNKRFLKAHLGAEVKKDTFSLNASAEHGLNWQQTRDIFSTVERIIHVLNMNVPFLIILDCPTITGLHHVNGLRLMKG